MTPPKRTPLKDIRKEEIMQAALAVLSERGSANVTLDDVAKASGFSKGGITYYYSSKDDLFKDVFEYFYKSVYKRSYEEIAKHQDPVGKLLSFTWLYDANDYQTKKLWPLFFDILALANNDEEYRKSFQWWVEKWVSITIEIVAEGKAAGCFQIDDVEDSARLIASISQGIGTRWFLDREHHTTEWATNSFKKAVISLLNVESG